MAHKLDVRKTVQAVAVLLHSDRCDRMSYLRLLKLLYIADRESLADTGRSMTGDRVLAMKHGPVLSAVYDLVEAAPSDAAGWSEFLRKDGYQLELVHDPGTTELSRYDLRKLHEVAARYRDCDEWDLVEVTHAFPEWLRNRPDESRGEKVRDISLDDVLAGVGRTGVAQIKEEIATEDAEDAFLDRFFAG